ncbi:Grx4 family monothiol glutaredoxin [Pseudobacteriovorax antillogorgiicola]|uniref:Glutaredoxin n=1 Tax=Pseudobacteriovorax antillogorgiicola TaxID=1513793 RepID=A0A1Y6CNS4_9BACT|nr:Grx4 family monothiol glutaredoxin [Pseudobacteriovorax antillogorgiicola]TCS44431.1 monothiol glutaredoxin [Pseudobacteriovorax antillogorgiicola]SMF78962.1 monothiol glutaredoxin [Pseudobacteriovorax antillogorgiicola]
MGEAEALAAIKQDVENNDIFLFMKGTPGEPMCGFSAQVVQVLNSYGVAYQSRNVLEDWDIREGVKQFTNWPTIPQLYVKGKFVGGCDIVMEMHRKDQLADVLKA